MHFYEKFYVRNLAFYPYVSDDDDEGHMPPKKKPKYEHQHHFLEEVEVIKMLHAG